MTRAFVHVGLALAVVLAPALCCCQAGWFARSAQTAHVPVALPSAALPPVGSCCVKAKKTCCDTSTDTREQSKPAEKPACACCAERPDAAPPEGQLAQTAPRPTGELLSLALAGLLAGFPEHAASVYGAHPPDRAGVDARSAALFERHVLRC